jgi:hypothetical protein
MPGENERIWDEYDWERFLQQQDRKTERYMELLEKYIDDPNRDQIIAREMEWHHLLDDKGQRWAEEVESLFSEEVEQEDEESEEKDAADFHPLYQASFALTLWIDQLFEELGDMQNHPAALKLATQSAVASAKLAAALSDDDVDEIGMTIAYLKRSLKAITDAISAGASLRSEIELNDERARELFDKLFQIRDGIITLMGEYRLEWRRRFGDS